MGSRTRSCTANPNQGHTANKHWLSKCSHSHGQIHTCTDSHQKKGRMDSSNFGRAQYFYLAKPLLALKSFKTFSRYVCDIKVKQFPKHSWKDASCFVEGKKVFLNKNAPCVLSSVTKPEVVLQMEAVTCFGFFFLTIHSSQIKELLAKFSHNFQNRT